MSLVKNSLQEKSAIYYERADVYECFSAAEDAPDMVLAWLLPQVRGKTLLDVGCGTGKYVRALAPHAAHITGLDAAQAQLDVLAPHVAALTNVTVVCGDAAQVPLPREHYDVIIACWMLGTVPDEKRRLAIVTRMERLLAPEGCILLVENDASGVFEEMRDRVAVSRTYHRWLADTGGFLPIHRCATRFGFADVAEARAVMGAIWGDEVAAKVDRPDFSHDVVIFKKTIRP